MNKRNFQVRNHSLPGFAGEHVGLERSLTSVLFGYKRTTWLAFRAIGPDVALERAAIMDETAAVLRGHGEYLLAKIKWLCRHFRLSRSAENSETVGARRAACQKLRSLEDELDALLATVHSLESHAASIRRYCATH